MPIRIWGRAQAKAIVSVTIGDDTVTRKDGLIVWSDKVVKPVAVRFAWDNIVQSNFGSKAGLPASSFRSDDWPGPTDNQMRDRKRETSTGRNPEACQTALIPVR
jgi:hypothetical protein